MKVFGFYCYYKSFVINDQSHYYNDLFKQLYNFFSDFIALIKLIHYLSDFIFSLYDLFPAFICANNTGSLDNTLSGVRIFNPFSSFSFSLSSSSSDMSGMSTNSSSPSSGAKKSYNHNH